MYCGYSDYAINNKLTPFISMQNHYNVVYREEEREMFPTLKVSFSAQVVVCAEVHQEMAMTDVRRRVHTVVTARPRIAHPTIRCENSTWRDRFVSLT